MAARAPAFSTLIHLQKPSEGKGGASPGAQNQSPTRAVGQPRPLSRDPEGWAEEGRASDSSASGGGGGAGGARSAPVRQRLLGRSTRPWRGSGGGGVRPGGGRAPAPEPPFSCPSPPAAAPCPHLPWSDTAPKAQRPWRRTQRPSCTPPAWLAWPPSSEQRQRAHGCFTPTVFPKRRD